MWRLVVTVLALVLLGACTATVEPPKAKVKFPTVSIDTESDGEFCPPGQAKKGRC